MQVQELMLKMGALSRYKKRVTTGGLLHPALRYSRLLKPALHHRGGSYGQHSTTAEALQAAL